MNTHNSCTSSRIFRSGLALLLCLSILLSLVPSVLAYDGSGSNVSDDFTLSEEQASALVSNVFGEDLQMVESDEEGYSYALTEKSAAYLLSNVLADDTATSDKLEKTNDLPENYVDDSNEDIGALLADSYASASNFAVKSASDKKVDLVFIIDSTGSMYNAIRDVKNNVTHFAQYLANMGVNLRLGLIDYRDITCDGLNSTVVHTKSFSPWFDVTGFIKELTTVTANAGGDWEETPIDALGHLTEGTISWNSDAYKFAMLVTDAGYKVNNQHGISSMAEMIEKLQAKDIQVSVVTQSGCMDDYGELAAYTGGIQANIYSDFGVLLEDYADAVLGAAQTKKDYGLRITESTTGLPVENAQISWNGGSATTNAMGIATITTRSNPVQNFRVIKDGYVTYSASSFTLMQNGCVSLELSVDDSSDDVSSDVPVIKPSTFRNPGKVTDTFKGPSIKLFGKEFNIFSVDIKMDIPVFNKVSVAHDGEEKKYSVMIGHEWEGKDPFEDPYWKSDYQKYKSLVKTFSDKSSKDIYNEFRTLRKNHKSKADLAFPVDMHVAGYADFSYATGTLLLEEGGIVIGVSTKEIPIGEWPLPPAPYVFFKLTFAADAKGTFSIVKVSSSGKMAMSVGLKEIGISPSLTGTLNLGVPKLASVGGGLKGNFAFDFTGLPPKKLEEILTISGNLNLIVKIKLLGFEASPEVEITGGTLYPSSKAKSAMALMSPGIEMSDFSPILPSAYPSTYSLSGLSDTLTFEKMAYADSTPEMIPYGDGWMLVWVDSNASREETDHMMLYYSVYTEDGGWSAPAAVSDDGTGDFSPSLVANADGNPVVVWQNATSVGASSLEERLQNLEIRASVFNPETNAFDTVVSVPSTPGLAPIAVQAVSDSDGVSVYWLENAGNDPFLTDGTVSIRKCDLLTEGEMTPNTLKTDSGLNGFAAGVMDGQDTYAYTKENTLFYGDATYTIGSDCRSTQFVDGKLYWSDSEGLKSFDGISILTEGSTVPADFVVAARDNTRILLLNQLTGDMDSDTSGVYASISHNGESWSDFTEIKEYDGWISGTMCAVMTDSGILWAAAKEFEDVPTLMVDAYMPAPDVQVAPDAYVSVLNRKPGEEVQVLIDLENKGLTDATDLQAKLADGTPVNMFVEGETGFDTTLTTLAAGERATVAVSYTLPADLTTNHEIVVDIFSNTTPNKQWGTSKVTVNGYPDLVVENLNVSRNDDGTATVSATIANRGCVTAVSPKVSLAVETTSLAVAYSDNTQTISSLDAGASEVVTFAVAAESIIASSPYDYKRLTLTATTETEEYNVADNSDSVLLAPLAVNEIAFTEGAVTLDIGKAHSLAYQLFPENAATTVSFMSNDTSVVTVSESGVLTPLKAGSTTVTVLAVESGKTDEILVTVNGTVDVGVSGVSVSPEKATLAVGETVKLTATVTPSGATNKAVTWSTSADDLVRITEEGNSIVVRALKEGTVDITAITADGSYTDTATITISGIADVKFTDVSEGAYYYDAVKWAVINGITSGTSATRFSPENICTRAQAVAFLWRAAGKPESTNAVDFTDVPADAYYAKAVAWAIENGITYGTSTTTFSPDAVCSRAQIVAFLWRAAGKPESTNAVDFTDVPADGYYTEAVAWAIENGITYGTSDTTFGPDENCTRAQVVTFLHRYMSE